MLDSALHIGAAWEVEQGAHDARRTSDRVSDANPGAR
jgi:hypothetical protein